MKRVLIALVVVILIVIVGGAVFLPSIARPAVEQAAETRGIDMEIGGLNVGVLSGSVGLSEFGLANEQGYRDAKLASVEDVVVNAELMPLLQGDLRVNSIRIDEPVLNLERLATGNINLADFVSRVTGGSSGGGSGETLPFRVNEIDIDDGTVQWTDGNVTSGLASVKIENLQVEVNDVYTPMPQGTNDTKVDVSGDFGAPGTGSFELKGNGNFLGEALDFDMTLSFADVGLTGFKDYYSSSPVVPQGGKASGTITATCTQNKIKGVARISLSELSLGANEGGNAAAKLPKETLGKLGQLQPVRDFEVPFEGDITDPTFHLFQGVMMSSLAFAGNLPAEVIGMLGDTGVALTQTATGLTEDVVTGAGEAVGGALEQFGSALGGLTGGGTAAEGEASEAGAEAAAEETTAEASDGGNKAKEAVGNLFGGFGKKTESAEGEAEEQ